MSSRIRGEIRPPARTMAQARKMTAAPSRTIATRQPSDASSLTHHGGMTTVQGTSAILPYTQVSLGFKQATTRQCEGLLTTGTLDN